MSGRGARRPHPRVFLETDPAMRACSMRSGRSADIPVRSNFRTPVRTDSALGFAKFLAADRNVRAPASGDPHVHAVAFLRQLHSNSGVKKRLIPFMGVAASGFLAVSAL